MEVNATEAATQAAATEAAMTACVRSTVRTCGAGDTNIIVWSDNHFNNLHVNISLETQHLDYWQVMFEKV